MSEQDNPLAARRFTRPGAIATTLFLLLFSGPPKFRIRSPEASLNGHIDFALLVNIVIWLFGGLWVACRMWKAWRERRSRIHLFLTHKMAAIAVGLLGVSIFVSLDPELTAFKVFQIIVALLFTSFFLELYGVDRFLDLLLIGCAALCSMIVVCAAIVPDLVLFMTDTGYPRLRGEAIADAGVVAALGTILLFTSVRRFSLPTFLCLSVLFGLVLLFSLARIAWLAAALFFAVAVLKRPAIRTMKWVYTFWVVVGVGLLAGAVGQMNMVRDPQSVSDLSGRLGLWAYLGTVTLSQSPWFGLGYLAASREIGMEYDPQLGSGHSIFVDVFVGGGLVTELAFLVLVIAMVVYAIKLLRRRRDAHSFAAACLMLTVVLIGAVGASIDSTPFGFIFWSLVTMLPLLKSLPDESQTQFAYRAPAWPWPSGPPLPHAG
ncbi:MAG TPA: O-antigen ligase family protein [Candidatus Acidoferrum sp.]|nr:O-antigen ligase family protein [Candidatus Acidoferrum sp.]